MEKIGGIDIKTYENPVISEENTPKKQIISQDQIHNLLFNREIGWQEIIYDLINTEQLDPWDVNIIILSDKFLEKINSLEEADFFVSSKVLLAASLLLRIKSEILLSKYIKSIDDILFGRKQEILSKSLERIELEEEIPELIPRSPMPRFRRVTLKELMESLNKAIVTENRRIKKEIIKSNALKEASISLPKRTINIKDKINGMMNRLTNHFSSQQTHKKITYTEFAGTEKKSRIEHFSPLLHIESQKKIWLEQEAPFDEIHIWEKRNFLEVKGDPFRDIIAQLKEGSVDEGFIEEIQEMISEDEEQ